jgi:myo-inosose-2 dehydratase
MGGNGWKVQVGANPIIWSNDDFLDLGEDISLERCLSEMHDAGYAGSELGHKFPRSPEALRPLLKRFDLQLVSGWHSTHLLEHTFQSEEERFAAHLDLLAAMGCRVAIAAECSRRIYHDPEQPLVFEARESLLSDGEWIRLANGLDEMAQMASHRGLRLVYHHHMGTVIQDRREIDRLLGLTHHVQLLMDTGHLLFADADPMEILRHHAKRIGHVHLKNVRPEIVLAARAERHSFATAVRSGVFTVPGDGGFDFTPVLQVLQQLGYEGWLVVEAEQDPRFAPPLQNARLGRETLQLLAGV